MTRDDAAVIFARAIAVDERVLEVSTDRAQVYVVMRDGTDFTFVVELYGEEG